MRSGGHRDYVPPLKKINPGRHRMWKVGKQGRKHDWLNYLQYITVNTEDSGRTASGVWSVSFRSQLVVEITGFKTATAKMIGEDQVESVQEKRPLAWQEFRRLCQADVGEGSWDLYIQGTAAELPPTIDSIPQQTETQGYPHHNSTQLWETQEQKVQGCTSCSFGSCWDNTAPTFVFLQWETSSFVPELQRMYSHRRTCLLLVLVCAPVDYGLLLSSQIFRGLFR